MRLEPLALPMAKAPSASPTRAEEAGGKPPQTLQPRTAADAQMLSHRTCVGLRVRRVYCPREHARKGTESLTVPEGVPSRATSAPRQYPQTTGTLAYPVYCEYWATAGSPLRVLRHAAARTRSTTRRRQSVRLRLRESGC